MLLREMLRYSYPLLILGIAGIMNQTIGTILYLTLYLTLRRRCDGVGIYGANYKIAIVMVMFIQAFRSPMSRLSSPRTRSAGATN